MINVQRQLYLERIQQMKTLALFFCFIIYLGKTSEFIFLPPLPTVALKKLPVEEIRKIVSTDRHAQQRQKHKTNERPVHPGLKIPLIHKYYTGKSESVTLYPSIITWEYQCSIEPNTSPYQWELLFTALQVNKELTNEYKCLLACINKKLGIHHINGKYNKVGFIEALEKIKPYYHGKDFVSDKRKALRCLDKTSEGKTECYTATKLLKCVDTTQIQAFQGFRSGIMAINKTVN